MKNFEILAGQKEATTAKSRRDQQAREDQLSHLNLDEPPPSPATSTTGPIGTTRSDDNLSPETKKFLGFAGKGYCFTGWDMYCISLYSAAYAAFLHSVKCTPWLLL